VWLVAVTGLLSPALLVWGFWSLRRKRLIENVPTSKVKGVFLGLNEVKGRALRDEPLRSFLAERPCVYYRYEVAEHWQRTVRTTDSKGRSQTRTESGWRTVDQGEAREPFFLEDDTGRLRVRPAGAEVDAATIFDETCGRGDALYYAKGPMGSISNSTHRRRFTEHAILMGARIYVLGPARLREDRVEPEIARERGAEMFLISTRSEEKLTSGYGFGAGGKLLFGAAAAFVLPAGLELERAGSFGAALERQMPWCLLAAGIFLGVVGLYYLLLVYNGLVSVRERAEMALSMIDVQLKRRHDLIPRLAACVAGYAKHEGEAHERVAAARVEGARGGGGAEHRTEAAAAQARALTTIFAVAEGYPELKADASFRRLQESLVDTEDRIALAREFHNASITALNNRVQTLPDSLVAALTRFRPGTWFAAQGFERSPVRIDLSA